MKLFIELRTILEGSIPSDIGKELGRRSAYNFIYGVSLFCYLKQNNLIQVAKQPHLTKIDKLKFILNYLQTTHPDLFYIDLEDYDLDDYTLRFKEELLLETAQKVFKLVKTIDKKDFWKTTEDFFIASF